MKCVPKGESETVNNDKTKGTEELLARRDRLGKAYVCNSLGCLRLASSCDTHTHTQTMKACFDTLSA